MESKVHDDANATTTRFNGSSPESNVEPYEDMSSKQHRISGESLPEIVLELCDPCNWCAACISKKGVLESCPMCGRVNVSMIPMTIDEICKIEYDEKRGIVIDFERKNPLR